MLKQFISGVAIAALLLLATLASVTTSAAAPYDGLWRPEEIFLPDGSGSYKATCEQDGVGGAIFFDGNGMSHMEGSCTFTNPAPVPRLKGTLFDVTCSGDFGSFSYPMMLVYGRDRAFGGEYLLEVTETDVEKYERCPE